MKARESRRIKYSQRGRLVRKELQTKIKNPDLDFDDKMKLVKKLTERKRDESTTRVRNRCRMCGRPRGVYRKFGLCRIHLREAVMRGDVPGLVKSSW